MFILFPVDDTGALEPEVPTNKSLKDQVDMQEQQLVQENNTHLRLEASAGLRENTAIQSTRAHKGAYPLGYPGRKKRKIIYYCFLVNFSIVVPSCGKSPALGEGQTHVVLGNSL